MAEIKMQKDGRYHAQVYLGRDVTGKRVVKSVANKSKEEVQKLCDQIERDHRESIAVAGGEATFSKWTEKWLSYKTSAIGAKQACAYGGMIARALPGFGNRKLRLIQTYDIQEFIDRLASCNPTTGRPTAKRTLKAYKDMFSQIFEFAIMNRAIDFNPARYVAIPRNAPNKTRRALTEQERQWIEKTAHRMQPMAMIMLYAGLRRGEVIPLEWSDIDFNADTISVTKAVTFIKGQPQLKPPKTEAGYRKVFLCAKLKEYLLGYKERAPDNELVCPGLSGGMYTESGFKKGWLSFQREMNITSELNPLRKSKYDPRFSTLDIDNITPHMLRHSFCSMMYESGVSVKTAQGQMGHASSAVTLGIYTHISDAFSREEMQKMNRF